MMIFLPFAILHALFSVKTFRLSHCMFRKKKKKVIPLGMHYVYCMQRQETTTPKRLETPKGYQRVPDQCYSSLLLSTKTTSLSFLFLLLASAPFPALASMTWDRISSMILRPYFSVFTFPMTFSSCLGFRQKRTPCYITSLAIANTSK